MLTPGFVLDIVGAICILPFTRPLFRRVLARAVSRRLVVMGPDVRRPGPGPQGPVVRGEVVDEDD